MPDSTTRSNTGRLKVGGVDLSRQRCLPEFEWKTSLSLRPRPPEKFGTPGGSKRWIPLTPAGLACTWPVAAQPNGGTTAIRSDVWAWEGFKGPQETTSRTLGSFDNLAGGAYRLRLGRGLLGRYFVLGWWVYLHPFPNRQPRICSQTRSSRHSHRPPPSKKLAGRASRLGRARFSPRGENTAVAYRIILQSHKTLTPPDVGAERWPLGTLCRTSPRSVAGGLRVLLRVLVDYHG